MLSDEFERLVIVTKPQAVFLALLRDLNALQAVEVDFAALTMNAKRLNIRRSIVMYYEFKAVRVSYHFVLFHGVLPQPGRCLFDARGICTRLSPAEAPQPPPCERSIQRCPRSITRFEKRAKAEPSSA
jgi:hypothetical protein